MTKITAKSKGGAEALIDRTRDAVVDVAERAESGVASATESIAGSAHMAADYIRDGAETATESAHRGVEGAARAIDRGYDRASTDLARASAATTDYVTENPGKALLLASSAGLVLGVLGTLVRLRRK